MKTRILSAARLTFPLASALAALLATQSASAVSGTWLGSSGDWNNAGTWSGGTIADGTGFTAIFSGTDITADQTITLTAPQTIGKITFTDSTTPSNNLTITGGNVLTLDATSGASVIDVTQSGRTLTINSQIAGTDGLQKNGDGALTLNGSVVNTFTGGLNVNGGTLTLDYTNLATPTNLIAATNALQINNGALTITGKNVAAATTVQTFASTLFGAGVNTVNIAKGALATSATLNLGALTVNSGSSTIFSPTTAWTTAASTTERVFISAGGSVPSLPVSGAAFVNAGVFHRVAGGAAGTLRLAAVNSSGQLLLKANAGNVAASNMTDATASYQWASGTSLALTNTAATAYGLLLNGTSASLSLTLAASGTLTLNSIIQIKATENLTIAPGTGTSNVIIGSEKNLVIAMDNTAGLAINAPIANNGSTGGVGGTASSLTIVGTASSPGTVTLGGANTYSGATTITRGTLSLTNVDALAATSGLTLGGTSAATLTTQTTGITLSAPITTANTGVTSTIAFGRATAATGSLTLNGAIGGNGNVTFTTPNVNSGGQNQVINLGAAGTWAGSTTMTTGNLNNTTIIRNTSGAANVLPVTTVLTMSGGVGTGSGRNVTFDLNGFDQELAGLQNTTAADRNQRVTSPTAATLTINNSADYTFGTATGGADPGNGQIAGAIALTKKGTGTFSLASGVGQTFTGKTVVEAGILSLGHVNSLQNSAFDTLNSMTGTSTGGLRATVTTLTLGGLTGNKNFADVFTTTSGGYSDLTALTLNPGTGASHSYSGNIGDGAGGMTLTKNGAGTQTLTGTNTHTGTTTISGGTLALDGSGSIASSPTIIVGASTTFDVSNVTGGYSLGTAQTLSGTGTVAGAMSVSGTLSPGNSPGILATDSQTWLNGGDYNWQVLDTAGVAGTGFDQIAVTGTLNLTNLTEGQFNINLWSLSSIAPDVNGDALSFNNALTQSWTILTTTGGISGFDSTDFLINVAANNGAGGFTNALGGGTFSLGATSNDLILTFTPVPEPRAALLGALGMMALLRRRRY